MDVNETENFTDILDIFQTNVVETQGNAIELIAYYWCIVLIENFYQALNKLHVEVECADADRDLNDLLRQLTQESNLT